MTAIALNNRRILDEQGYLHLRQAYTSDAVDEVDALLECLSAELEASGEGTFIELDNATGKISGLIRSAVFTSTKRLAAELLNSTPVHDFDHAIFKAPGSPAVEWHQDQTYRRMTRIMPHLHFWIPLHDVTAANGAIQYLEGSGQAPLKPHRPTGHKHYVALPHPSPTDGKIITCECKKGDVLIHGPLVIHRSLPNLSDYPRKSWILQFGPQGSLKRLIMPNLNRILKRGMPRFAD